MFTLYFFKYIYRTLHHCTYLQLFGLPLPFMHIPVRDAVLCQPIFGIWFLTNGIEEVELS